MYYSIDGIATHIGVILPAIMADFVYIVVVIMMAPNVCILYVETEQLIRSAGTCQLAAAILDAVEKWSEAHILHKPRRAHQHVMQ